MTRRISARTPNQTFAQPATVRTCRQDLRSPQEEAALADEAVGQIETGKFHAGESGHEDSALACDRSRVDAAVQVAHESAVGSGWRGMAGQSEPWSPSRRDRVAALHRQAAADYASGVVARTGMDRTEALRREMWGSSGTSPACPRLSAWRRARSAIVQAFDFWPHKSP